MKITSLKTFLANAGLRNYLFVRLTTDQGLTGIGEATLEWQEKTVETILHEWVEGRVMGRDAFDIEAVIGGMIRDQYQGGSTVMTAISSVEIAMWDLIGKACGQPVYKLHRAAGVTSGFPLTRTAGMEARNPRGIRRARARCGEARLPGHEIRSVRHGLEGTAPGGRGAGLRDHPGGARRRWRRASG